MTSQNTFVYPAAAGLPPGWSFVPPPNTALQGVAPSQCASPALQSSHPPETLPPSPSQALVLAGSQPPTHPLEVQWSSVPRRYPQKENAYCYTADAHDAQQVSQFYQPYLITPAIVAESTPHKRKKKSCSHHRKTDAHTQMVPPPPPPQPTEARSVSSIPTIPFDAQTRTGSPFRVWHVCQICHQPRSKSYHLRHPVQYGDSMPAPSICHRCKAFKDEYEEIVISRGREQPSEPVPRVQEIETDEESVVHSKVSREEYVSEWMHESNVPPPEAPKRQPHYPPPRHSHTKITTRIYLDDGETSAAPTRIPTQSPTPTAPSRPLLYRHVEAPRHVDGVQPLESIVESEKPESLSPRSAIAAAQVASHHHSTTAWMHCPEGHPTAPSSPKAPSMSSSKVREIAQEEIKKMQGMPIPIMQAYVPQVHVVSNFVTPSEVRRIVGEETLRLATSTSPLPQINDPVSSKSSSVTPSEVRRIARQEIKSYRGAERAVQDHPNPYSHGYAVAIEPGDCFQPSTEALSVRPVMSAASQAAPSKYAKESDAAASRMDRAQGRSDTEAEYFYISRKSEATSHPPPPPTRTQSVPQPKMEHVVSEKDIVEQWPGETRERHYRAAEVYHNEPSEGRGTYADTVGPNSSISQRPPRDVKQRKQRPERSYISQQFVEDDYAGSFPRMRKDNDRSSKDVNIGRSSDISSNARGSGIAHEAVFAAVNVRPKSSAATQRPHDPNRNLRHEIEDLDYHFSHQVSVHEVPRRPDPTAERSPIRHSSAIAHGYQTSPTQQMYIEEESQCGLTATMAGQRLEKPGEAVFSRAQRSRSRFRSSEYAADMGLAVVDERPVGDATYVRETYAAPPPSRDSDEVTVWPGHVPGPGRRVPLDSVAMHKQRLGTRREDERQELPRHMGVDNGPYIIPRRSVLRVPSPPRDEDIVRDDRRVYRERDSSRERITRERLVRVSHDSPERRGRHFRSSQRDTPPAQYASRFDEDSRFGEPAPRPRSILRPGSTPPGDGGGFYNNARVTFASRDNIAPMPQRRGHGFDGPNSSCSDSDLIDSGSEHTNDIIWTDGDEITTRGRAVNREGYSTGVDPYVPEMKSVQTRPLSESPSRERAEDLRKKAEKKKVRVQVMSDCHAPYRAELSPSSSMEGLADHSQVDHDGSRPPAMVRSRTMPGDPERMPTIGEGHERPPVAPGWLRVTKVKQYIDANGRPYEVVNEEIVLDDQGDPGRAGPPQSRFSGDSRNHRMG